jgi:glycosyltransferase involved in cell wall biosynthesis
MAIFTSHIPTLYVVTPCLNAAATIDRTIQSIVTQAGRFHLHYHIQDGIREMWEQQIK